jgi:hypothetical protein
MLLIGNFQRSGGEPGHVGSFRTARLAAVDRRIEPPAATIDGRPR